MRNATSLSKESLGYDLTLAVTGFTANGTSADSGRNRRRASADVAHAIVEYTGTTENGDLDSVAENLLKATNTAAESSDLLVSAVYLVPPKIVNSSTGKFTISANLRAKLVF